MFKIEILKKVTLPSDLSIYTENPKRHAYEVGAVIDNVDDRYFERFNQNDIKSFIKVIEEKKVVKKETPKKVVKKK